jgi:hypothetical protein
MTRNISQDVIDRFKKKGYVEKDGELVKYSKSPNAGTYISDRIIGYGSRYRHIQQRLRGSVKSGYRTKKTRAIYYYNDGSRIRGSVTNYSGGGNDNTKQKAQNKVASKLDTARRVGQKKSEVLGQRNKKIKEINRLQHKNTAEIVNTYNLGQIKKQNEYARSFKIADQIVNDKFRNQQYYNIPTNKKAPVVNKVFEDKLGLVATSSNYIKPEKKSIHDKAGLWGKTFSTLDRGINVVGAYGDRERRSTQRILNEGMVKGSTGEKIDKLLKKNPLRFKSDTQFLQTASYFTPYLGSTRIIGDAGSIGITASTKEGREYIAKNPKLFASEGIKVVSYGALRGYFAYRNANSAQGVVNKLSKTTTKVFGKQTYTSTKVTNMVNADVTQEKTSTVFSKITNKLLDKSGKQIGSEVVSVNKFNQPIKSVVNTAKNKIIADYSDDLVKYTVFKKTSSKLKKIGNFDIINKAKGKDPLIVDFFSTSTKGKVKYPSGYKTSVNKQGNIVVEQAYRKDIAGYKQTHNIISGGRTSNTNEVFRVGQKTKITSYQEAQVTDKLVKNKEVTNLGGGTTFISKSEKVYPKQVKFVNQKVKYPENKIYVNVESNMLKMRQIKESAVNSHIKTKTSSSISYEFEKIPKKINVVGLEPFQLNPKYWGKAGQLQSQFTMPSISKTKTSQKVSIYTPDTKVASPSQFSITQQQVLKPKSNIIGTISIQSQNLTMNKDIKLQNAIKVSSKNKQAILLSTVQKQRFKTNQVAKQRQIQVQKQVYSQKQKVTQVSKQQLIQTTEQQVVTEQIQKPKITQKITPKIGTTPRLGTSITPPIIIPPTVLTPVVPNSFGNIGSKLVKGFNVYVKKRGMFEKTNTRALSRNDALNLGAFRVGNSSAATFKIIAANEAVSGTFAGKGNFNDFERKSGGLFIEKRGRRIKSQGELKDITYKGIAAKKIKSKVNSLFGNKSRRGIFG